MAGGRLLYFGCPTMVIQRSSDGREYTFTLQYATEKEQDFYTERKSSTEKNRNFIHRSRPKRSNAQVIRLAAKFVAHEIDHCRLDAREAVGKLLRRLLRDFVEEAWGAETAQQCSSVHQRGRKEVVKFQRGLLERFWRKRWLRGWLLARLVEAPRIFLRNNT